MSLSVVTRAVQSSQGAFQLINLALVINLLPLGQFQCFQDIIHFIERVFQLLNNLVDLLNGLGDGGDFRAAFAFGLRFGRGPGLRWHGPAFNSLHSFNGCGWCDGFGLLKILRGRLGWLNRPGRFGGCFGR